MSEFLHSFACGHTSWCEHIKPDGRKTQSFTVVYAHGFCSDPYGRKPEEVKKWCVENHQGFFRYEIAGHGKDIGRFEETTIDIYKSQLFEIIEKLVDGPVVMVGSSLGGWLGLLACCKFPVRIIGFVGLAAAPDLLKTYFEKFISSEYQELMDKNGKIEFPTKDFTYVITKKMIESGHDSLLLENDEIPYEGKVILLQGMKDASLEWRTAPLIAQKLKSDDVEVRLIKNSNHRLGTDKDMMILRESLDKFLINN